MSNSSDMTRWFETVGKGDVELVGGKNSSLGEMIQHLRPQGIRVPDGFATTAAAYREFIRANGLEDKIRTLIEDFKKDENQLERVGRGIRRLFLNTAFPEQLEEELISCYNELSKRFNIQEADVAVRSSATAEDLPDASFAGQQETFLNVVGPEELLAACRKCYASLFTDRAISYREHQGFDHMEVALSIGIQKMVRSDLASSGVMFTLDTESGFPDVIVIDGAWGIGETVVQGAVTPDEYQVFKPLLNGGGFKPIISKELGTKQVKMVYALGEISTLKTVETTRRERDRFVLEDDEILTLAEWASKIEKHYGCPMDMEWAKDGQSGDLFLVQARPETVQSRRDNNKFLTYRLTETGEQICEGIAVGDSISTGRARVLKDTEDLKSFKDGEILVTEITDPNWVPVMKRAAGIITDQGGRTSHAAIISRELGLPAVVAAETATEDIKDGDLITLCCAEGDRGKIYRGQLAFEKDEIDLADIPETKTKIKLNIASPSAAFRWWQLPAHGIGLARMEFIISNVIKIHPMALINYPHLDDQEAIITIAQMTEGYADKTEFFVDRLALGIAKIAASQYPESVIVRMSDFKTNEYADLIGGRQYEPKEENPMLGFRGASRYYSDAYKEGFALECRAIKKVREVIGMKNVWIMIPFCRTLEEADKVLQVLVENGLKRGDNDLKVYVMCEIPANVILAEEFAERFDGFSIGSNDLTQLTLGVDRDASALTYLFDERNEAVKRVIKQVIDAAHKKGKDVGICGQGPSDYPDFAEFLVEAGIDSISLNPDSVIEVKRRIAKMEK